MSTLAPIQLVDSATVRLSSSLEDGKSYIVQNTGNQDALYCNYPTDPLNENVGWRICEPLDFFSTNTVDDTDNPLWARGRFNNTQLSVGEAP